MAKKIVIVAEKPSVAREICASLTSLGPFSPRGGYHESATVIVTHCVGHLVEIFTPDAEVKGAPLPIIPESFKLRPIERTKNQFAIVKMLINEASEVINACDAGREGEAIFMLSYIHAGCRAPVTRMWLNSMTHDSIRAAFQDRRPGAEYAGLWAAAQSRNEADWLIGINGTRAMSRALQMIANCGRVQSPTLALIVKRQNEITSFVPKDYFLVQGQLSVESGAKYAGTWINPSPADDDSMDRTMDKAQADAVAARCSGQSVTGVEQTTKPSSKLAPKLFDLTSLQREANKKFGFSAAETLSIAQALYERHKATTYPRTDSQNLPDDYVETAKQTVAALAAHGTPVSQFAQKITSEGWVKPSKRVFDSLKVSDHFAIIPTLQAPSGLSEAEQKIYDMVVRRFLAVFFPQAEYQDTTRVTTIAQERFLSKGRVLSSPGWLVIYGVTPTGTSEADDEDDKQDPQLCAYRQGERVKNEGIKVIGKKTTAPRPYTEATLLSAMEHAGKTVEDHEAAEALKERGLGTPATRASTIEGLVAVKEGREAYVTRNGKNLIPSKTGISLIDFLISKGINSLVSAATTGEWELRLREMEKGRYGRERFMAEIGEETRRIVAGVGAGGSAAVGPRGEELCACPKCKTGKVLLGNRTAQCACGMTFWHTNIAGKTLTKNQVLGLLTKGQIGVVKGFTSKANKPFEAALKLNRESWSADFVFAARP